MRFPKLFPFLLFIILFSAFSNGKIFSKKYVGIYDRELLLSEMPANKKIIDSLAHYRTALDSLEFLMFDELYKKRKAFYKDSAKFSAPVKQVKQYELMELRSRIGEFSVSINWELQRLKQQLQYPLNLQITEAANSVLIKNKKPLTMLDKKDINDSLGYYPFAKVVDANNAIRVKLGIPVVK
jgi:hypothetical protein